MDLGLTGRTALVCGASALGLACAEALAEEGANVVLFARRADTLESEARRLGGLPVVGDVRDVHHLERAVETAATTYGGLDILVCNSGGPPPGPALDLEVDEAQQAVTLLLLPVVRLVKLAMPYLQRSDQGRIILIGSVSVREPIRNLALSNAVRPGMAGFMKTLAAEVAARGITVNTVAPGRIATERMTELYGGDPPAEEIAAIPAGRFGQPRELGDLVAFLCSSRATYVTGTLIPVDGGSTRALA